MGRFLAAFLALSVLGATCTAEEATNRLCKYEVVMMVGEYILLTLFLPAAKPAGQEAPNLSSYSRSCSSSGQFPIRDHKGHNKHQGHHC